MLLQPALCVLADHEPTRCRGLITEITAIRRLGYPRGYGGAALERSQRCAALGSRGGRPVSPLREVRSDETRGVPDEVSAGVRPRGPAGAPRPRRTPGSPLFFYFALNLNVSAAARRP